jgi:AcrR family transcriptional regulator
MRSQPLSAGKPKSTEKRSDKRVDKGVATRAALLVAGRELFGERGFAATSLDDVVARAGVTKGALYHHFTNKEDLFRAVFEQVSNEVSDLAVELFLLPDSWEALVVGCNRWIDANLDPTVQRIALRDARAVLEWDVVQEIETRYGAVAIRGALRKARHAQVIDEQPLRPLSLMLLGALREACLYVADADDPAVARAEVTELVDRLLSSLRTAAAPV